MPENDEPKGRVISFFEAKDGYIHLRIDSPGGVAQHAPIKDPMAFIVTAAGQLDLEVDDSENTDGRGPVTISVPAES